MNKNRISLYWFLCVGGVNILQFMLLIMVVLVLLPYVEGTKLLGVKNQSQRL